MGHLIAIQGDGVAARTCATLLRRAGFEVARTPVDRPRIPAILLADQAADLLRDVFDRPGLFRDAPQIRQRLVAWGTASEPQTLPHSAVVVSESTLLQALGPDAPASGPPSPAPAPDFTIYTAGPLPAASVPTRFGSRKATAAAARTNSSIACAIEALETGWLFLVPNASQGASLIAIGAPLDDLLERSRSIRPLVSAIEPLPGEFSACPRIALPLGSAEAPTPWLACGTAAMAFDPICGDGTAHAVREAILAAAVVRAIAAGADADELVAYYQTRLLVGMHRHLTLCAEYYRTGGDSAWWQAELAALDAGAVWCADRIAQAPPPKYQLRGFDLLSRLQ